MDDLYSLLVFFFFIVVPIIKNLTKKKDEENSRLGHELIFFSCIIITIFVAL